MFKRVSAAVAAMSLAFVSSWAVATPASAAPPTAPFDGAAGGSTSRFDLNAGAIDLTNVDLTVSTSTVDSQATPRSVSRSENLVADVAGFPVGPDANQQVAPPDQGGAETGTLATVNALGINGGAVTTRNEAHWPGDGACLAAGVPFADTTTSTDGTSVSPLGADLVTSGASSTRGVVSLESTGGDGLNRAVQSVATGTIGNTDVFGGLVTIAITGDAVLTASADGTAGGATVDYQAPVVTITEGGNTQTVQPGQTVTIDLGATGSVSLTANDEVSTIDPNGLSARSTVDVATLDVQLGAAGILGNASFDLLPLNASARVPAGGIDCPAPLDITAPADGATVADPTPVISGTGQPGANVTITVNGVDYGPVVVDADGTFSVPVTNPLPPGTYTATGVQTDADGNPIGTDDVTFTVATPAPPVITAPGDGDTTGPTPRITGTGEPGATITVTVGGVEVGTAVVDDDGNFAVDVTDPLGEGPQTAVATETIDGVEIGTDTVDFIVDTNAAPDAPVVQQPADGSVTTDTTPTITGTGEPGATVTVTIDGQEVGTADVGDDGNFSLELDDPLALGDHQVSATQTDPAGNESEPSAVNNFRIAAPAVIQAPADDSTTSDPTPAVTGTGDPGATVTVSIDGNEVGTTTVGDDGTFSFTPTDPLDDGDHTVTVAQTAPDGTDLGTDEVTFTVAAATGGGPGAGPGNSPGPGAGPGNGPGPGAGPGSGPGNGQPTDSLGSLAQTGGPALWVGIIGALLILAGAGTVIQRRRLRA